MLVPISAHARARIACSPVSEASGGISGCCQWVRMKSMSRPYAWRAGGLENTTPSTYEFFFRGQGRLRRPWPRWAPPAPPAQRSCGCPAASRGSDLAQGSAWVQPSSHMPRWCWFRPGRGRAAHAAQNSPNRPIPVWGHIPGWCAPGSK